MSERPTSATGSGLWPTPTVCGNYNRKGASSTSGDGLATAVKRSLWPTPTKSDGSGGPGVSGRAGGLNLRTAVAQWPTPTATLENSTAGGTIADKARLEER